MIKLLKSGKYSLIETVDHTKILHLDESMKYAWVDAKDIGEILVTTKKQFTRGNILALGAYRLYKVKDEPELTDLEHLELFVGDGTWQGYLLPTGLPNGTRRRRIVATGEVITKSTI